MSKTVVFFGSGPVAAESLDFLSKHFSIEAVITKSVHPHHKGVAPIEELAKTLNLSVLFANSKQELDNLIDQHSFTSDLGIIVDYGVIVSKKVIDSFKLGIINSHFSLLPEWRGADPITFSILSGQITTGVSLMLIEPTLDTGNILAQEKITIDTDETTSGLTKKLITLSNQLLLDYVPKYVNGQIKPTAQINPDKATYSHKLVKSDGIIDFKKTADQIEREVRAYLGWPGSWIVYKDNNIIIKSAHVSSNPQSKLDILCGDNKYLSIDELIAPSGRKMLTKDFINGYH